MNISVFLAALNIGIWLFNAVVVTKLSERIPNFGAACMAACWCIAELRRAGIAL